MRMGCLEVIDSGTLRYLASYSGLRRLDLFGVNDRILSQLSASDIILKHASTLQELCIDTHRPGPRFWFEPYTLDAVNIAACVRLRSLKLCVCGATPEDIATISEYESITPSVVSLRICLKTIILIQLSVG